MSLKMLFAKWQPFCLSLNMLVKCICSPESGPDRCRDLPITTGLRAGTRKLASFSWPGSAGHFMANHLFPRPMTWQDYPLSKSLVFLVLGPIEIQECFQDYSSTKTPFLYLALRAKYIAMVDIV